MASKKYKILLLLFSIAVIFSALLSFVPISKLCDPTAQEESTCSKVLSSQYSKTFGIPNSYLGLFAFLILLVLNISQIKQPSKKKESILLFGVVVTSIFALYLIYLQIFMIKEICKFCMVVDISSILSLITVLYFGMD